MKRVVRVRFASPTYLRPMIIKEYGNVGVGTSTPAVIETNPVQGRVFLSASFARGLRATRQHTPEWP